jgi:anion-transporting  ArsA/GET3 family ATPase
MAYIEEIEDDEFDEIVAEKRHKEITKKLGDVATALSNQSDKAIVNAINGQGEKVAALVKAIENLPNPEKVNVEINQDKILPSLQQISKDIIESNNKVIAALENRLLPDNFELVKGYGGITTSVKVNSKQANQITIKK